MGLFVYDTYDWCLFRTFLNACIMSRLLFPCRRFIRDLGIFISNTIFQLIYYIGEGHMIFKKVIKGGQGRFFVFLCIFR